MSQEPIPPSYTPADDARDAALWRELSAKVQECLNGDSSFASIFGGEDNLNASVRYQSRGRSGLELTLSWMADNEERENLTTSVLAMRREAMVRKAHYEAEQPIAGSDRPPLPEGTRISYADMEATVVEDHGGNRLTVDCEGERVRWYWTFDGETCVVLPQAKASPQ